jgi:hypothetical protein
MTNEVLSMKWDRLRQIGRAIRAGEHAMGFHMSEWYGHDWDAAGNKCGTIACLAGWACLLKTGKEPDPSVNIGGQAAEWLETEVAVEKDDGSPVYSSLNALFIPPRYLDYNKLSKHPRVCDMIEWMADNKRADWIAAAEAFGVLPEIRYVGQQI